MNPNFKPEFKEYLEANGFKQSNDNRAYQIYYLKENYGVMISGNSVDMVEFGPCYKALKHYSFAGLNNLDLDGWAMLLHLTGLVHCERLGRRVIPIVFEESVTEET